MRWPKTLAGAKRAQERLAAEVKITPLEKIPEFIAAADAAFSGDRVFAVASLLSYPGLVLLEEAAVSAEADFPYVPGYLTFREGPSIIRAIRQLKRKPDILLVDGQGIAHPRRMGIAAHVGVLLDIPTIGCAKSRLVGEHEEPGVKKGCWSPLLYKKETVGAVLRTRDGTRPVFVSPGHRINLEDSLKIVLACTQSFRIPEPLRRADFLSKKRKRDEKYSDSK